jgi:hypothetical protein
LHYYSEKRDSLLLTCLFNDFLLSYFILFPVPSLCRVLYITLTLDVHRETLGKEREAIFVGTHGGNVSQRSPRLSVAYAFKRREEKKKVM